MVEQEEKRWLRALLEGEVEPGSEEWEQVCTDSAFTRVREKVGAVARGDVERVGGPEEEGVGAAGPGAETFIAVDIRDGCGGGVGNRRMVIDPGSGKRTGGCGRRKNGRG